MAPGFRPSHAVQDDDAYPRASRVQSSMNWRQPTPAAVPTQPQGDALADGSADITKARKGAFLRTETGPSPNYRGDPTIASNRSAVIPDSKNTSLWVTALPRECASYSDLMDMLKGRGKIFAARINDAPSHFRTAAATVTFFRHVDADNVMRAINNGSLRAPLVSQATARRCTRNAGSLIISAASDDQDDMLVLPEGEGPTLIEVESEETTLIDIEPAETTGKSKSPSNQQSDGVRLRAFWNRVRVAEMELRPGHVREHREYRGCPQGPSRVIRVRGLPEWVEPASLEAYFNTRFRYDLDRVIYRGMTRDGFSPFHLFTYFSSRARISYIDLLPVLNRGMPLSRDGLV